MAIEAAICVRKAAEVVSLGGGVLPAVRAVDVVAEEALVDNARALLCALRHLAFVQGVAHGAVRHLSFLFLSLS